MPRRYLVRFILSSITLWVLMRGILAGGGVWVPEPLVSLAVVAITLWLIRFDTRTMAEDVFLWNLGTPRWQVWAAAGGPALVLEIAVGIAARSLGWA